jgi:hypothetical protein
MNANVDQVAGDKLTQYLTEMDQKDAAAVEAELVTPVLQHTKLAEILSNHGFPISEKSVRRARKNWEI